MPISFFQSCPSVSPQQLCTATTSVVGGVGGAALMRFLLNASVGASIGSGFGFAVVLAACFYVPTFKRSEEETPLRPTATPSVL